jgi:xylose isomerase
VPGRYDQDFRFGSANVKSAFWLVKFLEDVGYDGPRHFDAHAYRTEDYDGVRDFARGCMRTYLILRERARQWNADPDIQALVAGLGKQGRRGLGYERLDQLTVEVLLGVRGDRR